MQFESARQVDEYLNHNEIECLECGRRFAFLPAHIKRMHGLDAAAYREKFNLPARSPLAGLLYRAAHRDKLKQQINSGQLTYDHLAAASDMARDAGRGQRTNYDLAEQAHRAENLPRQQLPTGARRADGRDADRAREYQREYRKRNQREK